MPRKKTPKPVKGTKTDVRSGNLLPAIVKATPVKTLPQVPRQRPIRIPGR
jgi:hypothetical protein